MKNKQYKEPEVDMTPVSQRDTSDLPMWIQKITPYFFIFLGIYIISMPISKGNIYSIEMVVLTALGGLLIKGGIKDMIKRRKEKKK